MVVRRKPIRFGECTLTGTRDEVSTLLCLMPTQAILDRARRVSNFDDEDELSGPSVNVRFGSQADVDHPTANGPLSPQERTLGLGMSALRGEADEDQRPSERPLLAITGH